MEIIVLKQMSDIIDRRNSGRYILYPAKRRKDASR
jgi:hypothetical protein